MAHRPWSIFNSGFKISAKPSPSYSRISSLTLTKPQLTTMRFISNTLAFLVLLSLLTISCKKKSKTDTDPANNTSNQNTNTITGPTCIPASDTSFATGYNNKDTYSYTGNGVIGSISSVSNSNAVTITYTYDGNGTLLKRDQGSGTYITYEFTSGKVSKFTNYTSNARSDYSTVEYQTGKIITKQYNTSDQLMMLKEDNISNENITSTTYTYYTVATGMVNDIFQYTFSNFDTKYSTGYITQKTDKSLIYFSKNNAQNSAYTYTTYNASGAVVSTGSGSNTFVFSYNTSGVPTQIITTTVSGATTSTLTQKYSYSGCN